MCIRKCEGAESIGQGGRRFSRSGEDAETDVAKGETLTGMRKNYVDRQIQKSFIEIGTLWDVDGSGAFFCFSILLGNHFIP